MPDRSRPAGRALVTRRAVADVTRSAVLGSYGVVGFARDPAGTLLARLGVAERGLRVRFREGRLLLEIRLRIAAGLPVAEVARQVDSAVRYSIRRALGRDVDELRIVVRGIGRVGIPTRDVAGGAASRRPDQPSEPGDRQAPDGASGREGAGSAARPPVAIAIDPEPADRPA